MNILNSPNLLALVTLFTYGLGAPFIATATKNGATPAGVAILYGTVGMVLAMLNEGSLALAHSVKGISYAAVTGLVLGIGLVSFTRALSLPGSNPAILTTISSAYPVVTILVALLMRTAGDVNLPRLVIGTLMAITGVILVATSTGKVAH
jgi:hypothetical protein